MPWEGSDYQELKDLRHAVIAVVAELKKINKNLEDLNCTVEAWIK